MLEIVYFFTIYEKNSIITFIIREKRDEDDQCNEAAHRYEGRGRSPPL